MKITIESTDRITDINGVPARVWRGITEAGTPCTLYVTRVQVEEGKHAEFDRELKEAPPKSAKCDMSIPLSMII